MRAVGLARLPNTAHTSFSVALCVSARSLSLSDLAKTFAEMSESHVATASPVPTGVESRHHRTAAPKVASTQGVFTASTRRGERCGKRLNTSNVMTFSAVYAEALSGLSGSQLTTLLECECKRQHHGHMLQCLVEVWLRLCEAPPTEILISDEEARGAGLGDTPAAAAAAASSSSSLRFCQFRSDMLLEVLLRVLAKTELSETLRCSDISEGLRRDDGSIWWVTDFSRLLLQWLTTRAALLSAVRSATFLHLIAQQKLFHCDAVLETLRDNVEVFLANYPACGSATAASSSADGVDKFNLSAFSVILDAIARWQLGVVRLLNADSVVPYRTTASFSAAAAVARIHHPILNPAFYNVVCSALLRGIRDGSLHLTRHSSPTTFFFLSLALAKIRWLHMECVEVLLPQLHEALRVFPAQFLGVVLLLGRREVKVCTFETTNLLIQTLLNAMQRRGCRYSVIAGDAQRRHRLDGDPLEASSAVLSGAPADYGASLVGDDCDENDDDIHLLSTESLADPVAAAAAAGGEKNREACSTAETSTAGGCSLPKASFTTSFVDLRSMPLFLDSFNHILSTTLKHCRSQGREEQWNTLNVKSAMFYNVFLSDTHVAVKSLQTLLDRPALVERLLHSLLHTPQNVQHPLFTEIVYVFTRHITARCVVRHDKSTRSSSSSSGGGGGDKTTGSLWQRRVLNHVELLVERGLLTEGTYVMSDEVVCAAPRVAAAVEAEKARLMERGRSVWCTAQNDPQKGRETAKGENKVQSAAVFAKFSHIVKQMQQQHMRSV